MCRVSSSTDIWAALVASLAALVVLLYFDVEAAIRLAHMDTGFEIPFLFMLICFLVTAQIAYVAWLYIRDNCPKNLSLFRKYLAKGKIVIGDVHYSPEENCPPFLTSVGVVVYRHPMPQYKGCYVRKNVTLPLSHRYSRELETLLILPIDPYSALPKTDIQLLLASAKKRNELAQFVAGYVMSIVIFCMLSAAFVAYAMAQLEGEEDKQESLFRYMGWFIVGAACIIIPSVGGLISLTAWTRHLAWTTKGNARIVRDDDAEYGTLDHLPAGVMSKIPPQEI
jgi:hypothetical protein